MAAASRASSSALERVSTGADTGTIKAVSADCYRIPLEKPLVDAAHGTHEFFELILCRIVTTSGHEGVGYTYTGGTGGRAIAEFIRTDLAAIVTGDDASDINGAWNKLQSQLHYVGRGGLLSFAISAVDIALWDIACRAEGQPLAKMIAAGEPATNIDTYCGFIDLHLDGDDLAKLAEEKLAEGFISLKTKVGRPNMAEDVERVRLLRSVMGADKRLMVDANFSLDVSRAIEFANAVEDQDIGWFEEPISPDNFEGYAQIADATSIPLAMGENLHIIEEFERAIRYSKLGILQPDASNVGGITAWLKICDLAEAAGIDVCTHGMHELHVSLLGGRAPTGCLEFHSFPIDQYTHHPLMLDEGRARVPDRPGTGVDFDDALLRPHLVQSR